MKRILCFGDSDTYGHDPRSFLGGRYPADVRWPERMAGLTGWQIINAGLNGREIPHRERELRDVQALFAANAPLDLGVVFLGSNDMMQGLSAQETTDRMEVLLDALAGYPLLLLAPVPMVSGTWVTEQRLVTESAKLAGLYEALSKRKGVHFADPGTWDIEMAFDGVHYSQEGHRVFARHIQAVIEPLLLETK